jgi:hypothetical protein
VVDLMGKWNSKCGVTGGCNSKCGVMSNGWVQ